MSDILVRFAHISDTHIEPEAGAAERNQRMIEHLRGSESLPSEVKAAVLHHLDSMMGDSWPYATALKAASALVESLNTRDDLDFVMHTGDVTNYGSPEEIESTRTIFGGLTVPIHYAVGNHDKIESLYALVGLDSSSEPYNHSFEVNGVRVICVDSSTGSEGIAWFVKPESLQWLEQQLTTTQQPTIVVIHHPPFTTGDAMHDFFVVRNHEEIHETLKKGLPHLRGVLSGHVHTHMDFTRDGIHYSITTMPFSKFPGYSIITVYAHGMAVERVSFQPA